MAQENLTTRSNGRRVHLVLSAGGVKCISYAGAVDVLAENGFEFASVSGSSAGSMIAAILASDVGFDGFKKAATALELSSLGEDVSWIPVVGMITKPFARYRKSMVAERFREIVGGDPTFEEMKLPFATFGVDLRTQKIHVYSTKATPKMRVADALRISTAAPFLFPPLEFEENILMDGAVVSQSPVWLATAYNDELPIIVLRPSKGVARPGPKNALEYVRDVIDVGGGSRDFYLMGQMPRVRLIEIDCDEVKFDQFHMTPEARLALVRSGRASVEADLKDLLRPDPLWAVKPDANIPQTRADKAATDAINSLVNALPAKRDQVFISYSRDDSEWLHRFQDALRPYMWNRSLKLWADTDIPDGADWNAEIKKALSTAKVAVLLVTINYLASEFIKHEELPAFIRAKEEEGLVLLWVMIRQCPYQHTPLAKYNAANNPEFPLEELSPAQQDAELTRICEKIYRALSPDGPINM